MITMKTLFITAAVLLGAGLVGYYLFQGKKKGPDLPVDKTKGFESSETEEELESESPEDILSEE